jgi:iron complex outermembrane recepter protein
VNRDIIHFCLATTAMVLVAVPAAAAAAGPAAAAAAADQSSADIVVTALKQDMSLLKTPASVTVLNSDTVARANITSVNQIEQLVPGLVLGQGASNSSSPFLRGIGTNAPVFSIELSIPLYYDGIYYGRSTDFGAPIYDLDTLQVIRGTQATLLGKNTSLGALSYENRRPETDMHASLTVSHTFDINENYATGFINLPLGQKVQMRAAFMTTTSDGYYYNNYTGDPEVRNKEISGRLSMAAQPTESINVVGIFQHDDRRLEGQNFEVLKDPAGTITKTAVAIGQVGFNNITDDIESEASDILGSTSTGVTPYNDQVINRLTGIITWDIGGPTITSQTGYANTKIHRSNDLDFTAGNLFNLTESEYSETFSQELRLASRAGERLTYLAGLYYYANNWELDRHFTGAAIRGLTYIPFSGDVHGDLNIDTKTFSAFGSLTYELVDRLHVTAGGRYTHEEKNISYVRSGTGSFTIAFPAVPYQTEKQTVDPFDYNASLDYQVTDSMLAYGSFAKGSKSGGFQDNPTTFAGGAYKPEKAYTAEIGAKFDLHSGRYLTAALYRSWVDDYQTAYTGTDVNNVSQTLIGNANVRSQGFELNGVYRVMPGLSFTGGVVYANAEYTDDFPIATGAIAKDGETLIRAPKWNGNLGANYETQVNDKFSFFADANMHFSSSYLHQLTLTRPDAPESGSYAIVDVTLGVREQSGWELSFVVNNLTNDRYINFATPVSFSGGVGTQAYYGNRNRPRVFGLQLKYAM